jgi:glycosyltransferase involved in cell wall biosynthesis
VLQIVPALCEEPNARTAINVAQALLQAGARAMIAADEGPLAAELRSFGGEWIPLVNATVNPFKLRRNARVLEEIIASERVDIVHAQSAGGAWSARLAAMQIAVWFVTTLPDVPPSSRLPAFILGALAQGDRVIAPSVFTALPMMQRYRIPNDQVTIIPRAIDTDVFDPAAVGLERVAKLREFWRIAPGERIILVPGRVAPWNGQILLPETARAMLAEGMRNCTFVIVGENRKHARYARTLLKQVRKLGVQAMFRLVGHHADMPAAFAAADVVAIPAIEPPVLGRVAAEAQAMGRPVVTSGIGALPEHVAVPPQIADELRTGWVVRPGEPVDFARALHRALTLDANAYQAMAARARQFAEYMFSPPSVAQATRAVYTSLLARDI